MSGRKDSLIAEQVSDALGCDSLYQGIDTLVERAVIASSQDDWTTDLVAVAKQFGIRETRIAEIPCDGLLVPNSDGGYEALISKHASPARQRFSLAHEIGHAIIHDLLPETRKLETRSVFVPPCSYNEERLCDLIASRLLMPTGKLHRFLCNDRIGIACVRRLATAFSVSVSAAVIRCREAFNTDAALITCCAFPSEQTAVFSRMLANFNIGRLYFACGSTFEEPTIIGKAVKESKTVRGWEWVKQRNVKRELYVEATPNRHGFGSPMLVMFSRQDPVKCELVNMAQFSMDEAF